jgi:hypothetical protein
MEIAYGEEGAVDGMSFQGAFPKTTCCIKCGKTSRMAFVAAEGSGDRFVCREHENDYKGEGFWLHDAAAFAVYLCTSIACCEATTLWNQA